MAQLTRLFTSIALDDPTVWLALGGGFAIVLVFLFLGRRQKRATAIVPPVAEQGANPADAWTPAPSRPDERRRSIRRSGVPTPVQVADPKKPKKLLNAFVLDRSSGGVRLASDKPFPTGSNLQVRPSHAHVDSPWVIIIVRSCREVGDYFEIGCQFEEELPWHMLLMFG